MKWGTSSGVYTKTVTATTSHVTKSQMCGAPANSTGWRDLGLIHQALMSGIQYTLNNGLRMVIIDTANRMIRVYSDDSDSKS